MPKSNHDGAVDIRHEPLANARMAYINKEPGRIICLIWGVNNVSRYVTTDHISAEFRKPRSKSRN